MHHDQVAISTPSRLLEIKARDQNKFFGLTACFAKYKSAKIIDNFIEILVRKLKKLEQFGKAKIKEELWEYYTKENKDELLDNLHTGKAKYSSIFNYPTLTWADIGAVGWLVDGAAIMNQVMLQRTSYGPYARAMVRICKEESFHQRQGFEIMTHLAFGTADQKAMAQDALNRWWYPTMMMFGPPDAESPNSENAMKWRIKRETNDQLRQKFVNQTVPQVEYLGLTVPDANLKWNEAKKGYDYSEPNWAEFKQVISGNGPCNKERLAARNKAHSDGAWVREAAQAFAKKRKEVYEAA